jgi:hypothetical protein
MVAMIEWGPLQRATNVQNQRVICRNFGINSNYGYVNGQIVIDDASDEEAVAECERSLVMLLDDALYELCHR